MTTTVSRCAPGHHATLPTPAQALQARLDALENDNDEKQHTLVDDSDDEFIIEEDIDGTWDRVGACGALPSPQTGSPAAPGKRKKRSSCLDAERVVPVSGTLPRALPSC